VIERKDMNRKTILLIVIICVVIVGLIYLITLQFSGRWIYVHELEGEYDISYYQFHNLTEEDMERFPFLLESIQTNSDVHISEEEYNELLDFLNNSMYIEWENRYYEVQLRMS